MEHTKGPWVAHAKLKDRPANHAQTPCVTAGEAGIMIADVWGGEKREANARLIAAAPELLEAIEEYRRWYDTCTKTNIPGWLKQAALASDRLDTAIARARGAA